MLSKIWIATEQWTWFIDDIYLYIVYGVDNNRDVERYKRETLEKAITWPQTWNKPTTLSDVQNLTYLNN